MVVENGSSGSAMYPWVEMLRLYCNMITLLLCNYCQILKLASWKFIYTIHASTSSYFVSYFSLFYHLSCINNWLNWLLFASIESSNFFQSNSLQEKRIYSFSCKPSNWKSQTYINLDHERNRVYFIQLPNLRRARQFRTIKKFSLRTDHKTATDA